MGMTALYIVKVEVVTKGMTDEERARTARARQRLDTWCDDKHDELRRLAKGMRPHLDNCPDRRLMFHLAVTPVVGSMRGLLAAHPSFHADFDGSLARAVSVAIRAANAVRPLMRTRGDSRPVRRAAAMAIGKAFNIPVPDPVPFAY